MLKQILNYFLLKWKCQRGEVGDDLNSDALADAVYSADIDDPDYVPPTDDNKDDDAADDDKDDDQDDPGDGDDQDDDDDKGDDKPDKISELENKLTEAQKEINRLGYALRKDKKEPKTDDKETPFTKTQLMQLYKENVDNPEVVFQIMDEMTKLGKVDATAAAEKSVDIKTKLTDLDKYIESIYPDAKKEGTPLYDDIQKAIEWAHLDGHPFAEHLAFGLLAVKSLPKTIEDIKKKAKEDALKISDKDLAKKAEEARKKNIKASQPAKGKGSSPDETKAASLTPDQLDTAKRLGLTTKAQLSRYAKMVGVGNKSGEMQIEA